LAIINFVAVGNVDFFAVIAGCFKIVESTGITAVISNHRSKIVVDNVVVIGVGKDAEEVALPCL